MAREFFKDLPDTDTPLDATRLNGLLNGEEALGSIVVDDINCKNKYNPSYRRSDGTLYCSLATGTENNGTYSLVASGTDMFMWQIRNVNDSYTENQGQLYEFTDDTYTLTISNSAMNKNFITYYNENKISLGYTQKNSNSFTFSKSDKTGAKYFSIRIGNGSATSGTTYSFTIQLEKGNTATTYTPFVNIIKEENGYVKEDTTFYANDFKCRNLFNPNSMIELNGQVRRYSDGTVVSVSGYLGLKIPVKPNTNYIVSSNVNANEISNLCFFTNNMTYISGATYDGSDKTFTTPTNCYYVTIALINSYSWFQLEAGSEVSPYTPYKNFENEDIYSTNEMVIGKWINGKKLYRRMFDMGALPSSTATSKQKNISAVNIDEITKMYGIAKNNNGTTTPLPSSGVAGGSIGCDIYMWSNGTDDVLTVFAHGDLSSFTSSYIIVEFTKTTD